jgi:hypothetical protein
MQLQPVQLPPACATSYDGWAMPPRVVSDQDEAAERTALKVTNRSLHGTEPEGSAAATLATHLLHGLDGRLAHSATVAAQIERVADLVETDWRPSARAAAWLHDVGYHPDLARTGFHPLDGARWLRDHAWPDETCRLVAWHTQSLEEALLYGFATELAAEFDPPPQLAASALAWADLTSSPNGELWDPERRLAEILDRYPPGSNVHEATRRSLPRLRAAVTQIEDLLCDRR